EAVCPAKKNAETRIGTRADPSMSRYRALIPTPFREVARRGQPSRILLPPTAKRNRLPVSWFAIFGRGLRKRVAGPLERAELDDVAPEEQGHGPVHDHPDLAVGGGDAQHVVGPVQKPRGEPTQPEPGDPRDPLVPAQRDQLAQVPVAERFR